MISTIYGTHYSPKDCHPSEYKLALLNDTKDVDIPWKMHGIWVEKCKECPDCTYPSCCPLEIPYEDPYDPDDFISTYWYNSTAHDDCVDGDPIVSLFTHEYMKHESCKDPPNTTTEYLNLAKELYTKFVLNTNEYTKGCLKKNIYIGLDENYEFNGNVECI
jgi:hypothetical protein